MSKTTMRSLQFHRTCASAFLSLDLGVSIGFKDKHGQTGKRQFLTQKKYVPFNFLPFAIKGYHFFKNPKSSKVDLGPHGLPRSIAKPRNPWGLLRSHNSLVQLLQVCLNRLSHGIPNSMKFIIFLAKWPFGAIWRVYPCISYFQTHMITVTLHVARGLDTFNIF